MREGTTKIKIKEAVIVEGKYDKITLSDFLDATIIETNGFQIYKDEEKLSMIRTLADKNGIVVLTDSEAWCGGHEAGNSFRGFKKSRSISE